MNRVLLLAVAALTLTGCAHGAGCDGFGPLRPKAATVDWLYQNDPAFADQTLAHNETGAARCGWKARP